MKSALNNVAQTFSTRHPSASASSLGVGIWDLVIGISPKAFCAVAILVCSMTPLAKAAPDLRVINTKHYEIHTDLDAAFANELAKRMDVMYEQYASRLSDFRPPKNAPALPAYLFQHEADYMAFAGDHAVNTGGLFVVEPHRTFLAAFLDNQGRDQIRRTLQHEAFHQFAFSAVCKDMPIWMNEGLAQLFEEGLWTGQTFMLGQVPPRRIRQLQDDIKNHTLVRFQKFFKITPDEWSENLSGSAEKGATYYNQAWAMIHFLSETGHDRYAKELIAYLKRLHNGEEPDEVYQTTYARNLQEIQDAFSDWALNLQPTPEATVLERQDTLGELLVYAVKQDKRSSKDMAVFRNTVVGHGDYIEYTRGHIKWTTSKQPQIYFASLGGQLYSPRQLYFQSSDETALPDIVCRATDELEIRTHFYHGDTKIEHEVYIEPAGK